MRYRKHNFAQKKAMNTSPCPNYHPQFIYWTQNKIVKDALSKGWRVVIQKMGRRCLVQS